MSIVPATHMEGEETTVTFQFLDELNNNAPVAFMNLMNYHGRYIHIQFASEDAELVWHVHPEDFYDITATGYGTYFWVNATFPRSGRYFIGASFLFMNGSSFREGASSEIIFVNGTTPMNNATYNYTAINSFKTYPIDDTDRILYPIDIETNLDESANGIKVIFQVIQQVSIHNHTHSTMTMTTGGVAPTVLSIDPPDNDAVVLNTCSPFYMQVFMDGGAPASTLIPYLRAPVHFTMVGPDGSVYHAHGSYLPDGILFPDLAGIVVAHAGMNMTPAEMMSDPMMNLTMNGMMMGILPNGSVNCRSDAGKVMQYMPNMDHSLFYGPVNFGPTIIGLFDWAGFGDWRVFAWMKIEINGEERLIVPHFSVRTVLGPSTSGHNHGGHSSSGAQSQFTGLFYLMTVLLSMGLLF